MALSDSTKFDSTKLDADTLRAVIRKLEERANQPDLSIEEARGIDIATELVRTLLEGTD